MNQNFYMVAQGVFDQWEQQAKSSKQIINFLVEYLAGDTYWLNANISEVDRETLVKLAKFLELKRRSCDEQI